MKVFVCIVLMVLLMSGCDSDAELISLINEARSSAPTTSTEFVTQPLQENKGDGVFSLSYYVNDEFNPLTCKTEQNRVVSLLMCEKLFDLNDDGSASAALCTDISSDGIRHVFKLSEDRTFNRSGEPVTAYDAVYSIELARKNEESFYYRNFSDIVSVIPTGEYEFTAVTNRKITNIEALFAVPVIKEGSAEFLDACGGYVMTADKSCLVAVNPCRMDTVMLYPVSDSGELVHAFQIGASDIAISHPLDTYRVQFPGAYDRTLLPTDSMQYILFNRKKRLSATERQSLSRSIDRESICDEIFGKLAYEATVPVPSDSYLYDASYELPFSVNPLDGIKGSLLVASENEYHTDAARSIADSWNSLGADISLEIVKRETFESRLSSGNFDMAYCRAQLPPDLSLYDVLKYGGEIPTDVETFYDRIFDECPIAPICFEYAAVLSHRNGIENLKFSRYDYLGFVGGFSMVE